MTKKRYLILTEIIIAAILVCACSSGQKAQETSESVDGASIESAVPEQPDVETETDGNADTASVLDLSRNGAAEQVRLADIDDGQGQRLEIRENNTLIYSKEGYFDSKEAYFGSDCISIFLCTLDGENYLLRYRPTMYQGVCMYSYELSDLTDNRESVVQRNSVDFDINFGSPIHNSFDPDAIFAFMEEINDLLAHSVPLLNTDSDLLGSFEGYYSDADLDTIYICQFHGQFGKVEKLTDAAWRLTLQELEPDTGYSVGEEWDETYGDYTVHYISSEPYGFEDADGTALKPGAQLILYSPDAVGHEPGTELYGAMEFQSWMHNHKEFNSEGDILGCWGLQNMETGQGFFVDPD